jgi:hypothetical protein
LTNNNDRAQGSNTGGDRRHVAAGAAHADMPDDLEKTNINMDISIENAMRVFTND